ncbi:MAG: metallophosphoesterase [Candidatus Komeilibacteria bacterium]|nr:metallophosphoesterase [Candidatus Komeilibacteria bacterium]
MGFIIFGLIFSTVFYLFELFILHQLRNIFDFAITNKWHILLIILALCFVTSGILAQALWNKTTQIFYILASAYYGLVWISFGVFFIYFVLKLVFPLPLEVGYASIFLALILTVFGLINGARMTTRFATISIPEAPRDLRIVLLADTHIGAVNRDDWLREVVKRTNDAQPDFILFAGDLIDGSGQVDSDTFTPLKDLRAPVYYTIGNHETYGDEKKYRQLLTDTGINILHDQTVQPDNGVQISGIGYYETDKRNKYTQAIQNLNLAKVPLNILVVHEPRDFSEWVDTPINLVVAGHTHAGQVWPLNWIEYFYYKQLVGYYSKDDKHMYISPGVGTWGPPLRLGSNNEVVVIDIKKGR